MTDEWLTPPPIIKPLGEFDLDPCSPINRPWPTAKNHFTVIDNGLLKDWFGRVWLNPPYGKQLVHWLNKMAMHGNGVALTFGRTDTEAFHQYVFPVADSILFLRGRLFFHHVDGTAAKWNGGAPSLLIAYGGENSDCLASCGLPGKHILINRVGFLVVGYNRSWKLIINGVFLNAGRPLELEELYSKIEAVAPEKVRGNTNYKAKIRQKVQQHFKKIKRGVYDKY